MKAPRNHPSAPIEGNTDEWWTPKYIFDVIGIEFDLDPCMPEEKIDYIPCKKSYDYVDDGLNKEWFGKIWLNPPYGRETGTWVEKLADHGNGIALVFARTDVKWWHKAVVKATAICFIKGRITFVPGIGQKVTSNSGAPSVLVAYGDECAQAIKNSNLGMTVFL
jgi:phage N-6-adenine-methyltransferase